MGTIRFDKISMYDRPQEPVTLAVPLPVAALEDPAGFGILDAGSPLPVQCAATARWEDGSVKWLLAHFLADLPGNAPHELEFALEGAVEGGGDAPAPGAKVTVAQAGSDVTIDTGPLAVTLNADGFDLFRTVTLNGRPIFAPDAFSGFEIETRGGERFGTAQSQGRIEVVEEGPLRAEVHVTGSHGGRAGTLLDYVVRLVAWAGKPWVEVDYQFINRERSGHVDLAAIGLSFRGSGAVRQALAEGHYRTAIKEGPGEKLLDAETIVYQAVEHVLEVFYGDFWADWSGASGGVTVTQFQAHQNFPKSLKVGDDGMQVGIYPKGQAPITILQGVAKTHRFMFQFHDGTTSLDDLCIRSLQFQYPDVAILEESAYRDSGVWENLFPENRCRKIESRIIDVADGRGRGLGMLHWGDGPDYGYTNQGRGKGELVWTNNEYDFPHAMFLMFARTGERRFRDVGLVAAQHWVDVDFCHYSEDPLRMGGQPIHTAGHVTGGVTPSHEWTEGLLDFYHFTGRREALEKAVSIADNMIRHLESPKFSQVGGYAARETGWAMRGLIAVYQETREARFLKACENITDQFLKWKEEWGAFLAPYTSHTKVRVPFMIAIAVNALARYHAVTGDKRVEGLIVEEMADLLDHCVMPDGRFFYKELPSLHRRAGSPREMEALCHAYRLSGDPKFIDHVAHMMEVQLDRGFGGGGGGGKSIQGDAVIFGGPGPKSFGSFYVPFMQTYVTLAREGRLDALDYRT